VQGGVFFFLSGIFSIFASLFDSSNASFLSAVRIVVAKGNETVEYACSLPQLAQGTTLRVSNQVTCQDRRTPLGVVASIVPFNFPRKFTTFQ